MSKVVKKEKFRIGFNTESKYRGFVVYAPQLSNGVGGENVNADTLEELQTKADEAITKRVKEGWTGSAEIKVYCQGQRCPLFDFVWVGFGPCQSPSDIRPAKDVKLPNE